MSPTLRTAALVAGLALLVLLVGPLVPALLALVLAGAVAVDARLARRTPAVTRDVPPVLARAVPARLRTEVTDEAAAGHVRVRQPLVPDLGVAPQEGDGGLDAELVARRRGRHVLPPAAVRRHGPLGLASWDHDAGEPAGLRVFPDVPAARRLAGAARQGRFREPGRRPRGPLGLGTEFESIREYRPDDDIRHVNWRATARAAQPMANAFRVEQERDVVCLLDCGRLMAAPLGDRTRLDAALDAATAVGYTADELGDRFGAVAFSDELLRVLRPRRRGGDAMVRSCYDLEPVGVEADYELAFRHVARLKRALVLVLTDLLDPAAARSLVRAAPVLARRHAVVVASATDPDVDERLAVAPATTGDALTMTVALDVAEARARAGAAVRAAGAEVLEAAPGALPAACVGAYLRAKARARL